MRRLIIVCGFVVALGVNACGQAEQRTGEPGEAPQQPASESALEVEQESDDGLAGVFRHDATTVEFGAASTGEGAANARITWDEREVTANRDRAKQQFAWSGGDAVLTTEDRTVLRSLARAFQVQWGPAAGGGPSGVADQRDLLLRLSMLLAEAPLGVPLGDHTG